MKLIEVGKIVNTFGIKGELKIVSYFEMPERVFKINNKLRINNIDFVITNVRFHKNNWLIELNSIKDINQIEYLKGYDVYYDIDSLELNNGEYLICELIDYDVYNNNKLVGKVTDFDISDINPLIKVNNKFYIPLKSNYINKIDRDKKCVITHNLEELML